MFAIILPLPDPVPDLVRTSTTVLRRVTHTGNFVHHRLSAHPSLQRFMRGSTFTHSKPIFVAHSLPSSFNNQHPLPYYRTAPPHSAPATHVSICTTGLRTDIFSTQVQINKRINIDTIIKGRLLFLFLPPFSSLTASLQLRYLLIGCLYGHCCWLPSIAIIYLVRPPFSRRSSPAYVYPTVPDTPSRRPPSPHVPTTSSFQRMAHRPGCCCSYPSTHYSSPGRLLCAEL